MSRHEQTRRTRRGYNMVEVVVSTLILGLVLVGATSMLGHSLQSRAAGLGIVDGPGITAHLIEEVLAMPFEDPEEPGNAIGVDTGESGFDRSTFDDIDDYEGWNKSPPESKAGVALTGLTGWRRQVAVQHVDPLSLTPGATDTGAKRVTVTVTAPNGTAYKQYAIRSRSGSLERPPAVDSTVVTWIGAELEVGDSAEKTMSGVHFHNHVTDTAP